MEITVIGELCRDYFYYGETNRLSPEAPVPVFNPLFHVENPGMAGNVVENLKSLNESSAPDPIPAIEDNMNQSPI